jgi:hypothetical protein
VSNSRLCLPIATRLSTPAAVAVQNEGSLSRLLISWHLLAIFIMDVPALAFLDGSSLDCRLLVAIEA